MKSYELSDQVRAVHGVVFLSGIQALARLPVEQLTADRRAGLHTAAFVSGYPGSPLGGFDAAVDRAARLAAHLPIVCRPAVNEEYAATAVMGSQLSMAQPDHRYDGVLGIWYGKAPGVDRATDALRHAVYAGTSRHGGAVALAGDDPGAKSSTIPSSSASVLQDLHMPLLYPGNPSEVLDLGRHAVALSRLSGLWTALKIVADVADGTASVVLDPDRVVPVLPDIGPDHANRTPEGRLLTPHTLDLEREIYEVRYEIAAEYASVNHLNRVTAGIGDAWFGIVASGITYGEVRDAFRRLGFADESSISALGVRLLKLEMPLPFHRDTVRNFAHGLAEVFVVEEKHPHLEILIRDACYSMADRPVVIGKHDEVGRELVPGFGRLDADTILPALRARLSARVGDRLPPPPPAPRPRIEISSAIARTPFYCSGCPHNRSTEVPDGVLVGAGIGCHTMALLMDPERVGDIVGVTAMGNEGMQWLGMSEFVERDHFVQNLGDGTYFHSGQLAITAAVAAGANITYKLLYNDVVAMTGGQTPRGQLPVPAVAEILLRQGVAQVLITTDDVHAYRKVRLPPGVDVWSRERLIEAQEHLATVPGVTVLIHDQACAAELRRRRKRGLAPVPQRRVVINARICEGCGDCGRVSNCLSVRPYDTPFGRKTRIDQTTCNLDFSCLEGDCPSFMTVEWKPPRWWRRGGRGNHAAPAGAERHSPDVPALDALLDRELPAPVPFGDHDDVTIRMVGIGGTGVVTAAQVIGTAAMLAGFHVRGLDQVGLSQKAGPVVSDLHLISDHDAESSRLGTGQADVLLVFDPLVAASDLGLQPSAADRTIVIGSSSATPPGALVTHPDIAMPSFEELDAALAAVTQSAHRHWADAIDLAAAAFGDAQTANTLVVGMALQAGAFPFAPEYLERAFTLNQVAVDTNLRALRLGRLLVLDPQAVADALPTVATGEREESVDDVITRLAADLAEYQDKAYAQTFVDAVTRAAQAERAVTPDSSELALAVARNLHKLMAYKDEYEVARLLTDADAHAEATAVAKGTGRVRYQLHPPVLRELGMQRKIAFGSWALPGFRVLARGKRLRGTRLDPFGHTKVRRAERALTHEYLDALAGILPNLTADDLGEAVRVAELPDIVRGYEDLKLTRIAEFRSQLAAGIRQRTP